MRNNYDEDYEKKIAYVRLRSKMEGILSKALSLNIKEDNLNSSIKVSLIVDDNIYEYDEYENIMDNTEGIITDIHETISNINSRI